MTEPADPHPTEGHLQPSSPTESAPRSMADVRPGATFGRDGGIV